MPETHPFLLAQAVLIVEDEPMILMMLEDDMRGLGATAIVGVTEAAEVVESLETVLFDFAVLDGKPDGEYDQSRRREGTARAAQPVRFCRLGRRH